jgi:glucosylglycerate synthase
LAEESFLSDEFIRQLTAVGEVDVIIGIITLNNLETIERVVEAAQVGLAKYFPRERTVVIVADGGSRDGTVDVVANSLIRDFRSMLASSPLRTVHCLTTSYPGIQGRGSAVRVVMTAADLLRAKACALVSPDLQSITPEWIESLIRPVLREEFDFVTPVYHRHKFDGLLVKNLVSPMMSAVFRSIVREPVGSELGFSGRFACHCLEQAVWHEQAMRFGVEVWMTAQAMVNEFRICQSFLGPKIHVAQPVGEGLVGTIRQVVGVLFSSLEKNESFWLAHSGMQAVPSFGFKYSVALEPIRLNKKLMLKMFRSGTEQLSTILQSILAAETFERIQAAGRLADKDFRIPDDLWVKTVYEFACSYHHSVINRDHLLQALTPLYRGRMASFVLENQGADGETIERKLDELGAEFERLKPGLDQNWARKT